MPWTYLVRAPGIWVTRAFGRPRGSFFRLSSACFGFRKPVGLPKTVQDGPRGLQGPFKTAQEAFKTRPRPDFDDFLEPT